MVAAASEESVLVIKLGALGDFIQALGPMVAIRAHHAAARLVLLTTPPYEELARATGLFDDIELDARPRGLDLGGWRNLRRFLRGGNFSRVYDLQTSDRSSFYYRLFWPGPKPQWSGIAAGCSLPHDNPGRDRMHTIERQADQLKMAGIDHVPQPDEILTGDGFAPADDEFLAALEVQKPYALLVPGGAAHRPDKRWPVENYAALAEHLQGNGVQPVLLGTRAEAETLTHIGEAIPQAINLTGRTGLVDLVRLARTAHVAIGNDTGPLHLIAAAGCPSLVLFSAASDPALCGQRGARVQILRQDRLADLHPDQVLSALKTI